LHWAQDTGLDNAVFLNEVADRGAGGEMGDGFREAADEATARSDAGGWETRDDDWDWTNGDDATNFSSPSNEEMRLPGLGISALFESALSRLMNGGTVAPRPKVDRDQFRRAAEDATKKRQEREKEEEDAEYRRRQRVHGE
jgi:hypothetical protein